VAPSQNGSWLDFERPVIEIDRRLAELRSFADRGDPEFMEEYERLSRRAEKVRLEIYSRLTRWQRVQLARHPQRPYTLDYLKILVPDFVELHGDRAFADDQAIVAGMGRFAGRSAVIVGHQKGRDTKENIKRTFGMPNPEGYRKALRVMQMASRFGLPVLTFIDTPGAYPGIGAEERGQFEAIARNLREMARLEVPVIGVVIGEGGSGGALAIGVTDRLLMLENAIYSVISPEGCAAILWRDRARAPDAAEALKITSRDLEELGIIDEVLPEPLGGAHRDPEQVARVIEEAVTRHLDELAVMPAAERRRQRARKYQAMGVYKEL
jgi:acetyl-CoA carboxylase carboxyl transferase subunit alpha